MNATIYLILATISGYTLAPLVHAIISGEFVFALGDILFILIVSPYCMARYLIVSHEFFPAWQTITTYLGTIIWAGSLFLKTPNTSLMRLKLLVAFTGAFIWNLGFAESGRYFLSA